MSMVVIINKFHQSKDEFNHPFSHNKDFFIEINFKKNKKNLL